MEKEKFVLIVDDDTDICNMLLMMLQLNGYAAAAAAQVESAFEMVS